MGGYEDIMEKYICLNPISDEGLKLFSDKYEQVEAVDDAEVILVRSADMHSMELTDNLKVIARAGAGVNNIPIDKCSEEGIVVFNTPGANANGVKEMVIAGLLLAARDISGGIKWVQDNKEDPNLLKTVEKAKKQFAGHEIKGKKLGVIGLGAIGVLVANIGIRLGMEVYGYDPFISLDHAWNVSRHIVHVNTREEIYRECDYITVHVPANEGTIEMIRKESIAQMKDGVVVLNYARNTLVNDEDMIAALEEGKVAKYVTDFPTPEIANIKNVIATPHLGASTEESEDNCAIMAVKQVMDYVENGNIKNSVNFPNVDAGKLVQGSRVTIIHKNIPQMLNKFTSIFGEEDINISNLVNKSKGDNAYTIFDVDNTYPDSVINRIEEIEGVFKVRTI